MLALPATPAARLLASSVAAAAAELAAIEYASMAIVTLGYVPSAFEKPLGGSGFLVPAVDGRLIKAATFSTQKWGWYDATGDVLVRCSIGRYRDVADLQRTDDELIAAAVRDLAAAVGVRGVPRDAVVTRWEVRCRSTRSGTSSGSRGSSPHWLRYPVWRRAVPRSTEWGYLRASAAGKGLPPRSSANCSAVERARENRRHERIRSRCAGDCGSRGNPDNPDGFHGVHGLHHVRRLPLRARRRRASRHRPRPGGRRGR